MYLIDYHTHSRLSPDADHPLTELAGAAVRAGLSELCVTDHYDRLTLDGRWEEPYDWAPALEQYRQAAGQFAGRLTLRLGIEYGGAPFDPEYARAMLARPEVDFVIGSLHNRSPQAGGADFYCGPYDTPEQCYAALDDYFASMERLVELPDCYDVVGHIIYPPALYARDHHPGPVLGAHRRHPPPGGGDRPGHRAQHLLRKDHRALAGRAGALPRPRRGAHHRGLRRSRPRAGGPGCEGGLCALGRVRLPVS